MRSIAKIGSKATIKIFEKNGLYDSFSIVY